MSIDIRWFDRIEPDERGTPLRVRVLQVRQLSDRLGGPGHGAWHDVRVDQDASSTAPKRDLVADAERNFGQALRAHGLTLMKAGASYEVVRLGELSAGG